MIIYNIVIVVNFYFQNRHEKEYFFKKIFLLTNTSIKVVLDILFFFLSKINV